MVQKFARLTASGVVSGLLMLGSTSAAQSAEPAPGKVNCDIKTKTVTVSAAPGFKLSPRGLWVLMEGIGKPPTRLAGPGGVFSAKPEN